VTEADGCELAQRCYPTVQWPGMQLVTNSYESYALTCTATPTW